MTKLIMGIGLPGSGKTTVLKEFAEKYGYAYICPDDIRLELTGNAMDQSMNREVWQKTYELTKSNLEAGKSSVVDATFTNEGQRQEFLDFAKANGAEKIHGIYLNIDLEVAKERNNSRDRVVPEFVLERMQKGLDDSNPNLKEGFDGIFKLNEYQELTEAEVRTARGNELTKNF